MGYRNEDEVNTNEFECPNCGERVYIEMLSCPKCGLHFFVDDATDNEPPPEVHFRRNRAYRDNVSDQGHQRYQGISASAILVGALLSVSAAFLVNLAASQIWTPRTINETGKALLMLTEPLCALLGGYLTARVAETHEYRQALLYGLAVSAVSLLAAYLLQSYWQNLTTWPTPTPVLVGWAVILVAGPAGAWLTQRRVAQPDPWESSYLEYKLYLELLSYIRHDINVAEQMIASERKRSPSASRVQLIRRAIEQMEKDRPDKVK